MRSGSLVFLALGIVGLVHLPSGAQPREAPDSDEGPARYGWLTSLADGKAQARKSGRPLMVVLRCVPCAACREFDEQVVRLEHLDDVAPQFVRVRLTRIEDLDPSLMEFDQDLTFMVFFLDGAGEVYARYGGRDAESPDSRQSLAGLRYTMQSVLRMHRSADKVFAPPPREALPSLRQVFDRRGSGRCLHCHQVKEAVNADLRRAGKWNRELVWRYPLPENLGLTLEVDRGNVVQRVKDASPASAAGLKPGDLLRRLNGVPIHSLADVQFALDRAPATGSIEVAWQSGDESHQGKVPLSEGWRKTDLSWRPSMQDFLPSAQLFGADLTPQQKQALGLPPRRLAFRQTFPLSAQAEAAGIRPGDVILGIPGEPLDTDRLGFHDYVRGHYLVGDRLPIRLLRDGKQLDLTMTLRR